MDAGFVRPSHRMLAQHAHTVDEVIAMASAPVPESRHKWLDRDGTPAMGMRPGEQLATSISRRGRRA